MIYVSVYKDIRDVLSARRKIWWVSKKNNKNDKFPRARDWTLTTDRNMVRSDALPTELRGTGLSCLSHGLPKPHKTASHSVLKAYTFEDHFRRPFSEYGLRFWGFPYTFCWQCFTRADSSPIQWSITCAMVNMIHKKKICRGLKIKDSFWVKNVRCLQSVRIFSIISPH